MSFLRPAARPHARRLIALVFALAALPVFALEIEGQRFDDSLKLGDATLVANGGGLRSRAWFKVYAMVLYLPEKKGEADAVLAAPGAKRIALVTLRDLTAAQFSGALKSGIEKNHAEAEQHALAERVAHFASAIDSAGEVKKGTSIQIDWLPESGTRLTIAGKTVGNDIAGEDFYRALLRIWIGKEPAQDDLKAALLGKAAK